MRRTSAVLAAILALFAQSPARSAPASPPEAVVLRIGVLPTDTAGEVLYAQDEGFFKAAGLDVRITMLPNGPAAGAAVIAGALDIGNSNVATIAAAREHGIGVRFLSPAGLYVHEAPTDVLMVAKDSPIRTAAGLNGKTVAVNGLKDLTHFAVQAWIDRNGGDAKSVNDIEMPFSQMAAALQAGRASAALLVEPLVTAALPVARPLGLAFDAVSNRFLVTGWFATDAWLEKNPETAARFAAVMRKTAQWANRHQRESAVILLKYTKITPDILTTMRRAEYAATLDAALMQPVIDSAAKYGALDRSIPASDVIWRPAAANSSERKGG